MIRLLLLLLAISQARAAPLCAAGVDCVGAQICETQPTAELPHFPCSSGFICTSGQVDFCPAGKFCPTAGNVIGCPSGDWCRRTSFKPVKCEPLSICPAGTERRRWLLLPIIVALVAILAGVWYFVHPRVMRRYAAPLADDKKAAVLPMVELTVIPSSDSPDNEKGKTRLGNFGLDLDFANLAVTLVKDGQPKTILADATGSFYHGRVAAIMGPSGAGKSTLVNVLSGRLTPTGGVLKVNGLMQPITPFRKVIGFVPQDDIMLRTLTVEEVIQHSADTRLPSDWTVAQRVALVDEVIDVLGLQQVRKSIIGGLDESGSRRGISGGERKRVNIAMELVSDASLIFLDEPTTGLDATSAQEVMQYLALVSRRKQVTVVAVLHQPRYEILRLCDDITLLAKGGQTVYSGSVRNAMGYFSELGFTCPSYVNPADFLLDITAGRMPAETDGEVPPNLVVTVDELVQNWRTHARDTKSDSMSLEREGGGARRRDQSDRMESIAHRRTTAPWYRLLWVFLKRSALKQFREPENILFDMLLMVIAGAALGVAGAGDDFYLPPLSNDVALACPSIIRGRCLNEDVSSTSLLLTGFFLTMIIGAMGAVSATRTFGGEKGVYHREAFAGVSPICYFIARNIFDLWNIALSCTTFLAVYFVIASPPGNFGFWWLTFFLLVYAAYGVGYFISSVTPTNQAMIVATLLGVALAVTTGAFPLLTSLDSWGPLQLFWYISYNRWTAEALYNVIADVGQGVFRTKVGAAYAGVSLGRGWMVRDWMLVILIGLCWRAASFIGLRYVDAKKQGAQPLGRLFKRATHAVKNRFC